MNKPTKRFTAVFNAPVLNRSGYGLTSDTIAKALMAYPMFDMLIVPSNWGSCAPRLIEQPGDAAIKDRFPKQREIPQPQILLSNTIPYMCKPEGTMYNINFCAGLEVDQCPDMFMNGVNQWQLNIVCSHYAKAGYLNSKIKPKGPVEVLNFGIDTDIFKITTDTNDNVEKCMANIAEQEAFLFIGQVTSPHLFGDRKDMSNLIKTFCEAFKGKARKPALILKTGGTVYSNADRNNTLARIQQVKSMVPDNDVNIYLIHGELSDLELNALMNHKKIIAHVSFTHSEGYGLPLIQGTLSGKPVIASNHSGHLDFLDAEHSLLLPGTVDVIPPYCESEFFIKGSKWFNVDYARAQKVLQDFFYNDRMAINAQALKLAEINTKKFNLMKFQSNLHRILDRYLGVKQ